ncbi:uncharacterized protein LOC141665168 [Apium graveolens]|uniref:uncharacterized protein LOC141665168 n=1 Tax=Apium graveolens TaxID=4045 RepID=UPI003D7B78CA
MSIPSWPFMKWGMDIVGKMPPAPGQKVFMLAMKYYFSKWTEAGAFKQTEAFYKRWNINLIKSTPRYPQANGQADSSNKIIINNLKRRLTMCKGKWDEELSWVLWSDRMNPKTSAGQMLYNLVYGTKAVLPTEIMIPTARYRLLMTDMNNMELAHDKDIVDELQEMAKVRLVSYQQRVANTFNKHVHVRAFRVGDLVLRKTFQNTVDATAGKFADTWEGPYFIDVVVGHGAY